MSYHLTAADNHVHFLRESLMRTLVQQLRQRPWTQKQAAQYLGVTQPRISDVFRAKTAKFSLDTLVKMLLSLDLAVDIQVGTAPYERSRSAAVQPHEDWTEAVRIYSDLVAEQPDNASARSQRALLYWRHGEYEKACEDYSVLIQQHPEVAGYRFNRAGVRLSSGQYRAALDDCRALAERFPEEDTHGIQARALEGLGQIAEAGLHYDLDVEKNPSRPGPRINRGRFYRDQGRLHEARRDYQVVLETDPTSSQARQALDQIEAILGDTETVTEE